MKPLSLRAYAKHRGVALQAVQKAVKSGRITLVKGAKGKKGIDPASADRQWDETTDPGMQRSQKSEATGTFQQARAMREAYRAKEAKLAYEERIGKLVSAERIKTEAFECARMVRDSILNIPNRIAHELAGETDPGKVHALLTVELNKALEELANAGKRRADS
ncbi:MAG: hypothetical protein A2428_03075 [Bdellovibrionales bacterium RIFOXYC1_FULL_54_43]|nr:MAG: hypothetical protein A2428_03075 [Bdellovibrionales bacterium RIFOXYC1_FULL_54_43]OFZ82664.1 MAG: hypothetical protein A2603_02510 [Bdellovibrionales bacterium RIFOXYD1_FULL_55_31]